MTNEVRCLFCGGRSEILDFWVQGVTYYAYECCDVDCGAAGPERLTREEALAAWTTPLALTAAVQAEREACITDIEYGCVGKPGFIMPDPYGDEIPKAIASLDAREAHVKEAIARIRSRSAVGVIAKPDAIESTPNVRGGALCVNGTRFPVSHLLADMASGEALPKICERYGLVFRDAQRAIEQVASWIDQENSLVDGSPAKPAVDVLGVVREYVEAHDELVRRFGHWVKRIGHGTLIPSRARVDKAYAALRSLPGAAASEPRECSAPGDGLTELQRMTMAAEVAAQEYEKLRAIVWEYVEAERAIERPHPREEQEELACEAARKYLALVAFVDGAPKVEKPTNEGESDEQS